MGRKRIYEDLGQLTNNEKQRRYKEKTYEKIKDAMIKVDVMADSMLREISRGSSTKTAPVDLSMLKNNVGNWAEHLKEVSAELEEASRRINYKPYGSSRMPKPRQKKPDAASEDTQKPKTRTGKGIWKPYSQRINEVLMYRAGRQLDVSEPLHGGNIEYSGEYTADREAAESLCENLNKR